MKAHNTDPEPYVTGRRSFTHSTPMGKRRSSLSSIGSLTSTSGYIAEEKLTLFHHEQHSDLTASSATFAGPGSARSSGIFKLDDDHDLSQISIKIIPYDPDAGDVQSMSAYITKFTPDFYDAIYKLTQLLGIMVSIRLQNDPEIPSNRRYSLTDEETGDIIATPKTPPIASKTNIYGSMCYGHITRDPEIQDSSSCLSDNKIPGELPLAISSQQSKKELLIFLQHTISEKIREAYIYQNLIVWREEITTDQSIVLRTFIQEAERLCYLLQKMLGTSPTYAFCQASNKALFFIGPKQRKYKADLTKLIPNHIISKKTIKFAGLKEFETFIKHEDLYLSHAPLSTLGSASHPFDTYVPEMVVCDKDGHVTCDADPMHFGVINDVPWIAHAIFNGAKNDQSKFINGLMLLIARLEAPHKNEFLQYIKECGFDVHDYLLTKELDGDEFKNYTQMPFFQDTFLPLVKQTLDKYLRHPELLKIVGESSIYSIIVQVAFNHKLSIHADEDKNPKPGEFGANLLCYRGKFMVSRNQASYLAVIFLYPEILRDQSIGVNPAWLCEHYNTLDLANQWLDVIEIKALYIAEKSVFDMHMYLQNIQRTFARFPAYADITCAKVEKLTLKFFHILQTSDTTQIAVHRQAIYEKYKKVTNHVKAQIEPDQDVRLSDLQDNKASLSLT